MDPGRRASGVDVPRMRKLSVVVVQGGNNDIWELYLRLEAMEDIERRLVRSLYRKQVETDKNMSLAT